MLEKIISSKSWITKFARTDDNGDSMDILKICLKNLLSNLKYVELIIKEITSRNSFFGMLVFCDMYSHLFSMLFVTNSMGMLVYIDILLKETNL